MNVVKQNPYGRLDAEHLVVFEKEIGVRLPEEYRNYLIEYNGGKWSSKVFYISDEEGYSTIHHVFGIHGGPAYSRLDSIFIRFKAQMGDQLLPIADDDAGNKICIGIRVDNFGRIYFWDHETDDVIPIASSFDEFVRSLSNEISNTSELENILENDDIDRLQDVVSAGYDIESLDEHGRSLIERAVIQAKPKLIEYLARKGANFRNSFELAEKNSKYFEEHKIIVELITKLKGELQ